LIEIFENAKNKLRTAAALNPSLKITADHHAGRMAEACIWPIAERLAEDGELGKAYQLLEAIRHFLPQTRAAKKDLAELTRIHHETSALLSAREGELDAARETMQLLAAKWPEGKDVVQTTLNSILAAGQISVDLKTEPTPDKVRSVLECMALLRDASIEDAEDFDRLSLTGRVALWRLKAGRIDADEARGIIEQLDLHARLCEEQNKAPVFEWEARMCLRIGLEGHLDLVLERCKKAFGDSRRSTELDTLGIVYALSGDRSRSAEILRKSQKLDESWRLLPEPVLERWIPMLERNENPLSDRVIEELKRLKPNEKVLLGVEG
jgi:hypothetical protein